jgi:SAM-dependent methyltransferase
MDGPPCELNIGAGHTYIPGFVNIDAEQRADVTLDLSVDPLPFPDDSVKTVFSLATLEHVPDYLFVLGEIHRVLRHDGLLLLVLPYVTLTEYHLINPYHLHNFSEYSFDFFDPYLLKGSAAERNDIALRRVYANFRYMDYFGLAPKPMRAWARRHLMNCVRDFDIGLVAIKDPDRAVDIGTGRARELEARMLELKRARTPYPRDGGDTRAARGRDAVGRSLRARARKRLQPYRERRAT